jgi:hypothetical protein
VFAGIANSGTLTISDSTITQNQACCSPFSGGGAIYSCCGIAPTLRDTVVTNNTPNDIVIAP